jgi:hypothetical protein
VLGARFKTGGRSQLSVTLPFHIAYTQRFSSKLSLTASLKPSGGINRYENRLSFATTDQTLVLRRRAFVASADLYYRFAESITIGAGAGIMVGRKLLFTDASRDQVYANNNVAAGMQFALKVIWRPWQQTLRNRENQEPPTTGDGPDDSMDVDMFGF